MTKVPYPKSKTDDLGQSLFFKFNGVFSKWSKTFTEFREFRESEKSLKHEFGLV